jgi:O-antigen ligase
LEREAAQQLVPEARSSRAFDAPSWWAQALLVAAIAWGAFAFGSVYPWAYWSLSAALVSVAMLSLLAASARPSLHLGPLTFALTLFAAAAACQLVSVPSEWLRILSSRALDVVSTFDLAAAAHPDRHPLSIAPQLTATGLVLFASFSLLVVGSARLVTIRGPRALAHAVAIIGVLLTMTAIIQKPLFTGKIYGFWTPEMGRNPFGPFVNKNHFAGWMMMALPVTLGLLCGGIARGMRHVKPNFHDRVLWLSSPDASRLFLLAGAAAVMALSLVLTLSRSGIAATLFALALTGVITLRRQGSATRRTIVTSYVVLLVIVVTAWVGVDTIVSLYAKADWSDFNDRRGPWADAAAIASKFPLTGTGLNTYGVATLFYQRHDLAHHYAEAHNDYLQLAAEGGLLLAVPAVLCVATLGTVIWKRFKEETSTSGYWIRVGAVTGLAAIALQETVEFSLQMPGNAALFAVLCGIALHASPERASQ